MQFNVSLSIEITVDSGISDYRSTDSHASTLQQEEVDKNFQKNCKKIPPILAALATTLVIANNGVQVWQNLHDNENISYLSAQLSSVEKVQLDYRKTN